MWVRLLAVRPAFASLTAFTPVLIKIYWCSTSGPAISTPPSDKSSNLYVHRLTELPPPREAPAGAGGTGRRDALLWPTRSVMRTRRKAAAVVSGGAPAKRSRCGTASATRAAGTSALASAPVSPSPACTSAARPARAADDGEAIVVAAIADTHGVLDAGFLAQLRAAAPAHVLHMGDVGDPRRKSRLAGAPTRLPAAAVIPQRMTTRRSDGAGGALLEALRAALAPDTTLSAVAGNVDEPDKALMASGLLGGRSSRAAGRCAGAGGAHSVVVEIYGWRLFLTHGHAPGLLVNAQGVMDAGMRSRTSEVGADVVLFGHSHKPLVARHARRDAAGPPEPVAPLVGGQWSIDRDGGGGGGGGVGGGLLLLNPGSAGPRRFTLPRCATG